MYSVHTKYEPQRVLNDTPIIKLFTTTLIVFFVVNCSI